MRESRTYGSVRGALSNERPYRDRRAAPRAHEDCSFARKERVGTRLRRLALLRHNLCGLCRGLGAPQVGQRGRLCTTALVKRKRMVAIEFGTWRSGRKGGSSGLIILG